MFQTLAAWVSILLAAVPRMCIRRMPVQCFSKSRGFPPDKILLISSFHIELNSSNDSAGSGAIHLFYRFRTTVYSMAGAQRSNSKTSSLRIPLLVDQDYEDFASFKIPSDDTASSSVSKARHLQSCLYFGLLDAFFNQRINPKDFASDASPHVLSYAPLDRLLSCHKPDPERQHKILKTLLAHIWALDTYRDYCTHCINENPFGEVKLGITILFHLLAEFCDYWFKSGTNLHPLISNRLLENEWCHSQVETMREFQNDLVAHYLTGLPNTNPKKLDHGNCPKTHCIARNVQSGTKYINKHSCESNLRTDHGHRSIEPCPLVEVDARKIRDIIDKGGIPLVSVSQPSSGKYALEVQVAQPRDRYVAISHVWSDGLGNPNENGLPECQIKFLARALSELPHPTSKRKRGDIRPVRSYGSLSLDLVRLSISIRTSKEPRLFWMDTLCIPVGTDDRTKELKRKAINNMAFIYGQSSQVLVLDGTLQEMELAHMRKAEVLARVLYSGWMGRSWTYQEGSLTPYVYFQFKDGALNPLVDLPEDLEWEDGDMKNEVWATRRPSLSSTLRRISSAIPRKLSSSKKSPLPTVDLLEETIVYRYFQTYVTTSLHFSALDEHLPAAWDALSRTAPLHPFLDTQFWIQQLCVTWNALRARSTTLPEDAPVILANLLGYQSYHVLRYAAEERLKIMLLSADVLPLYLLYNTGERLTDRKGTFDHWIPKTLGRGLLPQLPLMRLTPGRDILIDPSVGMADICVQVLVFIHDRRARSQNAFFIEFENQILELRCFREAKNRDTTSVTKHDTLSLLFDPRSGLGCALLTTATPDSESTYEALYECPIRITQISSSVVPDSVYSCILPSSKSWKIKIVNDTEEVLKPLSKIRRAVTAKRAFSGKEDVGWVRTVVSWSIPLLLMIVVATILRIYIASKMGWHDMSRLGKASLMLFLVQRLPTPLLLLPVSQIVFVIDKNRRGTWSGVDYAYVVLDLFWIGYTVFLIPWLIYRWMVYRFHLQLGVWDENGKGIVDTRTWVKNMFGRKSNNC